MSRRDAGICALSANVDRCFMAYPASEEKGEIIIYDALNLQIVTVIQAHQTAVRAIAFNQDGTMLATTSHKGTVVRVFAVPSGRKLHTFRRGTYSSNVYSIAFNQSSTLICLSSATGTVHIFDLLAPQSSEKAPASTVSKLSSYLPNMFHDIVDPVRSFAHVNLKEKQMRTICGFSGDSTLLVVTAGGHYYRYSIPKQGGDCKLEAEHSLLNAPSDAIGVKFHDSNNQALPNEPLSPDHKAELPVLNQDHNPMDTLVIPPPTAPPPPPPKQNNESKTEQPNNMKQ